MVSPDETHNGSGRASGAVPEVRLCPVKKGAVSGSLFDRDEEEM